MPTTTFQVQKEFYTHFLKLEGQMICFLKSNLVNSAKPRSLQWWLKKEKIMFERLAEFKYRSKREGLVFEETDILVNADQNHW